MNPEIYLGNGVHATFDGAAITLLSVRGTRPTDELYDVIDLLPATFIKLSEFADQCWGKKEQTVA